MKRFYVAGRKRQPCDDWCTHVVKDRDNDDHLLCASREDLCELVAASMNLTSDLACTPMFFAADKKGEESDAG